MSNTDDQPPPTLEELSKVINKLSNKYELGEYIQFLTTYHSSILTDEISDMRERLFLQGLDEDDLYTVHSFLHINFDGELMKMHDKDLTQKRANQISQFL